MKDTSVVSASKGADLLELNKQAFLKELDNLCKKYLVRLEVELLHETPNAQMIITRPVVKWIFEDPL